MHANGAWKIAYADFATAMMSFFLLLWLIIALKPEQKTGLATFFDPQTVTTATTSGAGGILGGRTIATDGSMVASYAPKSTATKMTQVHDEVPTAESIPIHPAEKSDTAEKNENNKKIVHWLDNPTTQQQHPDMGIDEKQKIREQVEAAEFRKAMKELHQALQTMPDAVQLERNLVIDQTPMFASGSTELNDAAKRILAIVATAIGKLPHKIAITGHTDGNPYHGSNGYNNWDLSVNRANASRRALIDGGLDSSRIASVVGKADTDHLYPKDPLAPINRRISFVLLRLKHTDTPVTP
jgi:chemotaxis protein MotB